MRIIGDYDMRNFKSPIMYYDNNGVCTKLMIYKKYINDLYYLGFDANEVEYWKNKHNEYGWFYINKNNFPVKCKSLFEAVSQLQKLNKYIENRCNFDVNYFETLVKSSRANNATLLNTAIRTSEIATNINYNGTIKSISTSELMSNAFYAKKMSDNNNNIEKVLESIFTLKTIIAQKDSIITGNILEYKRLEQVALNDGKDTEVLILQNANWYYRQSDIF